MEVDIPLAIASVIIFVTVFGLAWLITYFIVKR